MATITTLPIITSSVSLLQVQASYSPTFSPLTIGDTPFFDEGPRTLNVTKPTATDRATSLGNLSSSYPYVQGVEMTKQSMYDKGLVKIWSGDTTHILKQCIFGQSKNYSLFPPFTVSGSARVQTQYFQDADRFNPQLFLQSQEFATTIFEPLLTFPIIIGDNDQLENYNLNGIIEPFPIRSVVGFFSTYAPTEPRGIRGELSDGNDNQLGGTDSILTVDYFDPTHGITPYLDMIDIINGLPLNGYFQYEFTPVLPWADTRYTRNTIDLNDDMDAVLVAALSLMTGSTGGYINFDQRSATCGWSYDNSTAIGTDSLAFGGMTY